MQPAGLPAHSVKRESDPHGRVITDSRSALDRQKRRHSPPFLPVLLHLLPPPTEQPCGISAPLGHTRPFQGAQRSRVMHTSTAICAGYLSARQHVAEITKSAERENGSLVNPLLTRATWHTVAPDSACVHTGRRSAAMLPRCHLTSQGERGCPLATKIIEITQS